MFQRCFADSGKQTAAGLGERNNAETTHRVEPIRERGRQPPKQTPKETRCRTASTPRGSPAASAPAHRRSTRERGAGGCRLRGLLQPDHRASVHGKRRLVGELRRQRLVARKPREAPAGEIAFARCMRSNGVPNFPDPNPAAVSPCVLESISDRPRSRRRRRSASTSCPPAPARGPHPPRRRWRGF